MYVCMYVFNENFHYAYPLLVFYDIPKYVYLSYAYLSLGAGFPRFHLWMFKGDMNTFAFVINLIN